MVLCVLNKIRLWVAERRCFIPSNFRLLQLSSLPRGRGGLLSQTLPSNKPWVVHCYHNYKPFLFLQIKLADYYLYINRADIQQVRCGSLTPYCGDTLTCSRSLCLGFCCKTYMSEPEAASGRYLMSSIYRDFLDSTSPLLQLREVLCCTIQLCLLCLRFTQKKTALDS